MVETSLEMVMMMVMMMIVIMIVMVTMIVMVMTIMVVVMLVRRSDMVKEFSNVSSNYLPEQMQRHIDCT